MRPLDAHVFLPPNHPEKPTAPRPLTHTTEQYGAVLVPRRQDAALCTKPANSRLLVPLGRRSLRDGLGRAEFADAPGPLPGKPRGLECRVRLAIVPPEKRASGDP